LKDNAIVWFRNDLRLHDNEALTDAISQCKNIIPVFVFDDRVFNGKSKFGFKKTGIHRANFIIESVADLKKNLKSKGSDLIIRVGKPEDIIFELARTFKSSFVFCNRERTRDEVAVQDALEENLWAIGQEIRYSRGKMLYYTSDLPFPITQTPDTFGVFKKEVERFIEIRKPLDTPSVISTTLKEDFELGEMPTLSDFGMENNYNASFRGGETKALKLLNDFKNNTVPFSENISSQGTQLSPYISLGCISPKMLYAKLLKNADFTNKSKDKHPMYNQLLTRDYHRLMGKKHGCSYFISSGINGVINTELRLDKEKVDSWIKGETQVPLVNAIMEELRNTGYIPDIARRIVSQYLIFDLGQNWLIGAYYFEEMLIDYDPCSNFGNWLEMANIGADLKENKKINYEASLHKYDPDFEYVNKWTKSKSVLNSSY
jgi:deoxyribodipyrimidine photo-lyase